AAIRAEDGVLAVNRLGSIRVADVSSRAVAGPAGPIIPAACVLRYVAPDRPLVANLGRCGGFGRLGQNGVTLPDDWVPDDLGERRHRADLDTAVAFTHA